MKKLFALLLCLCMLLSLAACGEPEDTETNNGGNTSTEGSSQPTEPDDGVRETVYAMTAQNHKYLDRGSEYSLTYEINDQGQIAKMVSAGDSEEVLVELTYGADGCPASMKVTQNGTLWGTVALSWDKIGNLIGIDYVEKGEHYAYTYDANGNMLSERGNDYYNEYTYDSNSNLLTSSEHRNDVLRREQARTYKNGVLSEVIITSYSSGGEKSQQTLELYDDYGNLLSQTNEAFDPNLTSYIDEYKYTYDAQGNMLTNAFYRDGKYMYGYSYTYDDNGNCISESTDGELQYTYSYDENGLLATRVQYNDSVVKRVTEYTYDANGNELGYTQTDLQGEKVGEESSTYKELTLTTKQAKVYRKMLELLKDFN